MTSVEILLTKMIIIWFLISGPLEKVDSSGPPRLWPGHTLVPIDLQDCAFVSWKSDNFTTRAKYVVTIDPTPGFRIAQQSAKRGTFYTSMQISHLNKNCIHIGTVNLAKYSRLLQVYKSPWELVSW